MLTKSISSLLLLCAALLVTAPDAAAQRRASGPETVEVVPVQRNARPRAYVKVIRVPGASPSHVGGTADQRNYLFFSRSGYAGRRAAARQWNSRFRPVPVLRQINQFGGFGYSPAVGGYNWAAPPLRRRW